MKCEEGFFVLMCEEVFMEKVRAIIKHGKKLRVASTCSKAFGFLVQLIVPPKSTVGFVSKLNHFYFGRCKRFLSNFSIIGFAVKSYTGWK
jgi:hypothetical protein